MVELIPVVDLLAEKKGRYKEAHLILFEYCNLRCSFCHQDHESKVGLDADLILGKVETLINNSDPNDSYVINMTGGELFLDEIPDWMFGYYLAAGQRLLEHFKDVKLVWGTNLIYEDTSRVERLVSMLRPYGHVCLATSYDPAGRFNESQRALFFKNLDRLGHLVETVNVVITKQNIQTFLDGKEGTEFAYMCQKHDVYFDHYIPSNLYTYHQPDEDLISQLYILLNERYPDSYPIKAWKANQFNETTCRSTKIVNKDGVVTTCWSEAGKDSILDEHEGLLAKAQAEQDFIDKYDCFSCDYYNRCGMRCFLHHSFIQDSNSVCQIREMYDKILT